MAVANSSADSHVYYAFETSAGERPTTGWKEIPDLTSTPEFNEEPNQLDYTPLSEPFQHRTRPGLRPAPSNSSYGANLTDEFYDAWEALCDEYDEKQESNLGLWFVTVITGFKLGIYQQVTPSRLGAPGLEVDSIVSIDAYISGNSAPKYDTKPTIG